MRNLTLGKKIAVIIALSIFALVLSGFFTVYNFYSVQKKWENFLNVVQKKQTHLMAIRTEIGYGGAIHLFKNYVLRGQEKYFDRYLKKKEIILSNIGAYKAAGSLSRVEIEMLDKTKDLVMVYEKAMLTAQKMLKSENSVKQIDKAIKINDNPFLTALNTLSEELAKQAATRASVMTKIVDRTIKSIMIGFPLLIIILSFISFKLSNSVTWQIKKSVKGLTRGSSQVNSAAASMSSSGQSLADASSMQAASMEETSSSLEEISSMTKNNSENAKQAEELMHNSEAVIKLATGSMTQLSESMVDITKASEETSKIIKTIDEISFQTNLLALNAAVEAARAGEAGAGFAVVADEVRNLAMRAADAAKSTAQLIDETVKKIHNGSKISVQTNELFVQVQESASKIGGLISEIASASIEQTQGIAQISSAVSEMDKITQQNAATSEETASAASVLSSHAVTIENIIMDLSVLVNANARKEHTISPGQDETYTTQDRAFMKLPGKISGSNFMKPSDVIPMDDDFKDF